MSAFSELRETVLIRDGGKCRYCGENARVVDHVLARFHGGTDSEENLVTACPKCNGIAAKRKFASFESKREYILAEMAKPMKDRRLSFAAKLQAFRSMKGLTVAQMASKSGINACTMERFLAGQNAPQAAALMRIMRAFDIQFTPEDFE